MTLAPFLARKEAVAAPSPEAPPDMIATTFWYIVLLLVVLPMAEQHVENFCLMPLIFASRNFWPMAPKIF